MRGPVLLYALVVAAQAQPAPQAPPAPAAPAAPAIADPLIGYDSGPKTSVPDDVLIRKFRIDNVRGAVYSVRLVTESENHPGKYPVAIVFHKNGQSHPIWLGDIDFPKEENGGRYARKIELSGLLPRNGVLEAILYGCREENSCVRQRIDLDVGDLNFEGVIQYPNLGRGNLIVRNYGPADTPKCWADVFAGKHRIRLFVIKKMVVNQDQLLSFTYEPAASSRDEVRVQLRCDDLANRNNRKFFGHLP